MDEKNDAIWEINTTFKKDREDSDIHKLKSEFFINKIENKVDRLLNFVTYIRRYTDDGMINQNTVGTDDTSVVCTTRDE